MVDEKDETTGRAGASDSQPQPVSPPVPSGAPSGGASVSVPMQADMAKILQEVKLPERREIASSNERQPRLQATDIDALLANPAPPEPPKVEAPPPKKKDAVQSLHTIRHDLQQVVHDQKISVVKAAALEQDKAKPPVFATSRQSNAAKKILFAGFLLLLLGGAALGGVYIVVQGRAAPLPQQPANSLVFAEQTVSLPLENQSSTQLKGILSGARSTASASLGSITRVAPITTIPQADGGARLATLQEFLFALGAKPPDELLRALSQEFFFGFHTVDTNAPFFVIPVLSYDRAFAGMLAWESAINAELSPLFVRVPDLTIGDDGLVQTRTFSDLVMRNYDVRALTDDSGAIALYYSFPTRNMLIVAESPYTFTELLSRLQAQRQL